MKKEKLGTTHEKFFYQILIPGREQKTWNREDCQKAKIQETPTELDPIDWKCSLIPSIKNV